MSAKPFKSFTRWALLLALVPLVAAAWFGSSAPPPPPPAKGFVTYSEGDTRDRRLVLRRLSGEGLGEPVSITAKGEGGDIMGTVSADGKWLAFARNMAPADRNATRDGQWPGFEDEDYHKFHAWDIYVVRLDGQLPAEAVRVGHGYWPSWGDDSDTSRKSLYFGQYESGTVRRAVIDDTAGVLEEAHYSDIPGWSAGDHHLQVSPDGRKVAIRIGNHVWLKGLRDLPIDKRLGPGCHPSWMADSRWLYHANSQLWHIEKGNTRGRQGGAYHFGSSIDSAWAITITDFDDNAQNRGWPLAIFALQSQKNDMLALADQPSLAMSDSGSWPDIHTE